MKLWTQHLIQRALKDVGVREQPRFSNDGPRVRQYLASVSLGAGFSYCASAVHCWGDEAAQELGIPNPIPKTGYCPALQKFARDHDILATDPRPGMSFLVVSLPSGEAHVRAHHTGVIVERNGNTLVCVEPNSNDNGSSNGDGVYKRERTISSKLQFVNWDALAKEVASPVVPPPVLAPYPDVPPQTLVTDGAFSVILSGRNIGVAPLWRMTEQSPATSVFPVRDWGNALGLPVGWDNDAQAVTLQGRVLPVDLLKFNGRAYAPIRQLAGFSGLIVGLDAVNKHILISRPK